MQIRFPRLLLALSVLLLVAAINPGVQAAGAQIQSGGTTYFVDCTAGRDANSGTAETQAWKSVDRANQATLAPGDTLLLKGGCSWLGPLQANWHGTSTQPILIGAYGGGDIPKLYNSRTPDEVEVKGTYQIIQDLQVSADPPARDPGCADQPVGWRVGFAVSGQHNTIQRVKASALTGGVHLTGTFNRILHSTLIDNVNMSQNTHNGENDDSGAWGIALNGDDNEVAYNYFSGNNAWCSYDFGQEGASVEVYQAQRNVIHHNIALNDTTFSELGGSASKQSNFNTFAYNQYIDTVHDRTEFLTLRGIGNKVYNNSVYLTGGDSRGLTVEGDSMTAVRNNIFEVRGHAAYAGGMISESNNLYWSDSGTPAVNFQGFTMSPTSRQIDPQFVQPGASDLHLQPTSPARDSGDSEPVEQGYGRDLDGVTVPSGAGVDIGAYEYGSSEAGYSDLLPGDPAYDAVRQLTILGVVKGYADGRFGPDDPILRAHSAALITRAMGWASEDWTTPFGDRGGVDNDLWRNVGTLAHYGVAKGYSDGNFRPLNPVLNAQAISLITRAMITKGYWQPQPDDRSLYPNVPASSGHRQDLATYTHYAGALPGRQATGSWDDWGGYTSRGWFAQALWRALDSDFRR